MDGLIFQFRRDGRAYFSASLWGGMFEVSGAYGSPTSSRSFVTTGEKTQLTLEFWHGLIFFGVGEALALLADLGTVTVEKGDVLCVGGLPGGNGIENWGGYFKGCLQDIRLDDVRLVMNESDVADGPTTERIYLPNHVEHVEKGCHSDNTCQVQATMVIIQKNYVQ